MLKKLSKQLLPISTNQSEQKIKEPELITPFKVVEEPIVAKKQETF